MPAESLTLRLATFAATLTYDALPADVIALAKRLTLDTLGTAFAAVTLGAGCREVVDVMTALGGKAESAILGTTTRVSAPNAAFANGTLAHALNYDAVGTETGHTGVVCLTPALAMAGACGPVSGRRFIAAAVAAAEVTARLTRAAGRVSPRILAGQYFGYLGAAAGSGSILELDAAQMHSAFGIALMQTAGSRQVVVGGDPPAKAIYGGFPNQAGVLAAFLAQAGLGAEIDAIDGKAGFYALATDGAFDEAALTAELGTTFAFTQTQFKPWPVSAHVAPFIEAALDIATQNDLSATNIAAVELTGHTAIRDWFEPLAERRHPANAASAANSTMFAVAKAFAHRAVTLADFTSEGLNDGSAAALADRMTYTLGETEAAIVAVTLNDGRRFERTIARPLGHPSRPLGDAHLEAKFRDCCSSAPALTPKRVDELVTAIAHLEDLDDIAELTRLP